MCLNKHTCKCSQLYKDKSIKVLKLSAYFIGSIPRISLCWYFACLVACFHELPCVCAHFHFINWILLCLYFLEFSLFMNCMARIFKFSMCFSWHTFVTAIFKIETKIYWSKDFRMFPWYRCLPIYSTFLANWIKNFCSASELQIWWATATYINGNSLIFLQLVLKGLKRCEWDA